MRKEITCTDRTTLKMERQSSTAYLYVLRRIVIGVASQIFMVELICGRQIFWMMHQVK